FLKTSSLADRIDWRDRAASFARRLAAGVGSGAAIPRAAAGRMGQTRLAKQNRTAAAQPGCILGRALFATPTMGGRDDSRFALWREDAAKTTRVYIGRHSHAGARDRREHCDFQCRERGGVAPASVQGGGSPGGRVGNQPSEQAE